MDRYIKQYKSAVIFAGVYIVSVFLFSVAAYHMDLRDEALSIASFVIMNVCILLCSVFSAKKAEKKGWLTGIVSAVIFTAIILFASIVLGGGSIDIHKLAVRLPLYLFIALVGGIVGINLK